MSTRLAISIIHGGYIHPLCTESCLNLRTPPNTVWRTLKGYNCDVSRNLSVAWARNENATHLLQIDSDIAAARDSVTRILDLGEPFCSGAYLRRDATCWELFNNRTALTELPTEPFWVEEAGAGFYLIELSALDTVPQPYYWNTYTDPDKFSQSEDRYFCKKILAHGYHTRVDPHIQLTHLD